MQKIKLTNQTKSIVYRLLSDCYYTFIRRFLRYKDYYWLSTQNLTVYSWFNIDLKIQDAGFVFAFNEIL